MKIEHILVATDLTETSHGAFPHVAAFAKASGARVTLLHVDEATEFRFAMTPMLTQHFEQLLKARDGLVQAAGAALESFGLDVGIEVRDGRPAATILDFARRCGADLIVTVRHGRSRGTSMIFGSVSKRVVRHSDRPVLVVHDGADGAAADPPIAATYRRITTGTDFSEDSARGLAETRRIATTFGASLDVMHVLQLPVYMPLVPGEAPLELVPAARERLVSGSRAELEAFIEESEVCDVERLVTIGERPSEELVRSAEARGSDLIVLPSHGKGALRAVLLGSTTERTVKLASMPVLVLPSAYLKP